MTNPMSRWILVLVLILTVVIATTGVAQADTITVCASGCDYTSIQAAVNAASAGDMIEVHSGTYYENVNVTKQLLTLRGVDSGGSIPVVDAGGIRSAIILSADGISLEGFNATNSGRSWQTVDAGIGITSDGNTLVGNTASDNYCGIHLLSSSNNTITDNTANSNDGLGGGIGIHLSSSSNNTITGNNASSNYQYGIYLSCSSNNILTSNTANGNIHGIHLLSSSNNTIAGNTASNNKNGIHLDYSCYYDTSDNNTIMDNNVSNNNHHGIYLYSSINNNVTSNTANNNHRYGIYFHSYSDPSINNNVIGNTANDNNYCGIGLYGFGYGTITGNTAINNSYGILLQYSRNDTIAGNTAINNSCGIHIEYSFNNTLNAGEFGSNNRWNTTIKPGPNIVGGPYMGGNYWSDYTGEDLNGDGFGDTLLPYTPSGIIYGGDYFPLIPILYAKGDLNGDGNVTPADAAIALRIAASGAHDDAADVSGDGQVTSLDALMILQAAAWAITPNR